VKNINIIHFSDIHCGTIEKEDPPLEQKTPFYPENLADLVQGPRRFKKISKSLIEQFRNGLNNIILISGDLTTYGKIENYELFLKYLRKRIPSEFFEKDSNFGVFIVPGNHDIDENKIDSGDLHPKFMPIINSLKKHGFYPIPCKNATNKKIEKESCSVLLVLLNSCIGCREIQYFPRDLQPYIQDYFDKESNRNPKFPLFNRFDTPFISEESIEDISRYISEQDTSLPIIIAHHNLLPPHNTEISIFSEMLNGGKLRDVLKSFNKPILFLHGHIHEDQVEIIQSPFYPNSKIICISAPMLFPNKEDKLGTIFGFNVIQIVFSDEGNILGCEIIFYRLDKNLMPFKTRIRFIIPPESGFYLLEEDREILKFITSSSTDKIYLKDINKFLNEGNIDENIYGNIEKILDKLDWLNLVKYDKDGFKSRSIVIPGRYVQRVIK
jgi:predicted MPP superfamily phosphohydrolase